MKIEQCCDVTHVCARESLLLVSIFGTLVTADGDRISLCHLESFGVFHGGTVIMTVFSLMLGTTGAEHLTI